jgi:hypothetical protein
MERPFGPGVRTDQLTRCDPCLDAPRRGQPAPAPGASDAAAIDCSETGARSYCVGGPSGRLLEAEPLGSASVLSLETEGSIGARTARLHRMAPGSPHGAEQVRCWGTHSSNPPETPFDAASSTHRAGDMLADALVEHGFVHGPPGTVNPGRLASLLNRILTVAAWLATSGRQARIGVGKAE